MNKGNEIKLIEASSNITNSIDDYLAKREGNAPQLTEKPFVFNVEEFELPLLEEI